MKAMDIRSFFKEQKEGNEEQVWVEVEEEFSPVDHLSKSKVKADMLLGLW